MPLLSDFVMNHPPAGGGDMHLVHCTSTLSSMQTLRDRSLNPTICPVYGTDLLYTFYGRPAYKPGSGLPASGIIDLAPVCLVLDPLLLANAVRVRPESLTLDYS